MGCGASSEGYPSYYSEQDVAIAEGQKQHLKEARAVAPKMSRTGAKAELTAVIEEAQTAEPLPPPGQYPETSDCGKSFHMDSVAAITPGEALAGNIPKDAPDD